jgi:uncharacterized protein YceK
MAVAGMSGCGTMLGNIGGLSLDNRMEIYGGVQCDLNGCARNLEEFGKASEDSARAAALAYGTLCIIDLPLSAVADTLTLPLTIKATLDSKPAAVAPADCNDTVGPMTEQAPAGGHS